MSLRFISFKEAAVACVAMPRMVKVMTSMLLEFMEKMGWIMARLEFIATGTRYEYIFHRNMRSKSPLTSFSHESLTVPVLRWYTGSFDRYNYAQ